MKLAIIGLSNSGKTTIISYTEKMMAKKFKDKPEVIKGNLEAIKRAYDEVVG